MKNYLLGVFCLISTLSFQYGCTWGLIIAGYFSGWIYACGGFILLIIVFMAQFINLVKLLFKPHTLKYPESIQQSQEDSLTAQVGVALLLISTFILNNKLAKEGINYEFQHYGRQTKGIISRTYTHRTGKGAKIPYLVCTFVENQQPKSIDIIMENGFENKKVGDSLEFVYSTRSSYYYKFVN